MFSTIIDITAIFGLAVVAAVIAVAIIILVTLVLADFFTWMVYEASLLWDKRTED